MSSNYSYKKPVPLYDCPQSWEFYSEQLRTEYQQSIDEGLDISKYQNLFESVASMEKSEHKSKIADVCFDLLMNADIAADYKYEEPSDLEGIQALRSPAPVLPAVNTDTLKSKIEGAWYGRICGCLLGKPVEGAKTTELVPFLKEIGNYPMHRYILQSDAKKEIVSKYKYPFRRLCHADIIDRAPIDDDTNYTVLYQKVIDEYGKDFQPADVTKAWLAWQPKTAYFTAEQTAYRNFLKGYMPPSSAVYQNPYREWIGAQIRADYFGYINPGNPEKAAEMAWRDACISHTKNGIYGEMFMAAMIAAAAVLDDIFEIISAGLAQIPAKSRLHEAVTRVVANYKNGMTCEDCFADIHNRWDEFNGHHWCHTISNAEICIAALLYGNNDYGTSICLAVQTGFDTDCNGATVGSILGMKNGIASIGTEWTAPIHGLQDTSIFGVGTIEVAELVEKTLKHIEQ